MTISMAPPTSRITPWSLLAAINTPPTTSIAAPIPRRAELP
jgi:hypothetical protein